MKTTSKRELIAPLTCPFCGAFPAIMPWHGGGPRKHLVTCDNDNCKVQPGVTGPTRNAAVRIWNDRNNATRMGIK